HVRLRFIAPGEDFVFARDAEIVDIEGSSRRTRLLLIGGAAALVAVLAVVVVARAIGGRGGGESPKSDVQSQVFRLNAEVDGALKQLDWDGAIAKATEGLKLDGAQEMLRDKKAKAEGEKK